MSVIGDKIWITKHPATIVGYDLRTGTVWIGCAWPT